MTTGLVTSRTNAIIQFSMALFPLPLACGAPIGEYGLGGQYRVLPEKMRHSHAVFAIIIAFIGFRLLQRSGIVDTEMNRILSFVFTRN